MAFKYSATKKLLKYNDKIQVIDIISNESKIVTYCDDLILDEYGHWHLWNNYFKNNTPRY